MIDLDTLRALVHEWDGIFDFGTDDDGVDILTFRPRACIDDRCACVSPCTANVAEFDTHESIATMLNALPALLADHARLGAEVDRLREGMEVQHMAEASRIAGADGCCGGCDAARLAAEVAQAERERAETVAMYAASQAEVARLRGLVVDLVKVARSGYDATTYGEREAYMTEVTRIRKEAAGE